MIEHALEHLELTAGLAARAMIEPTAVLDGRSMTGPDLTSVSANISMIEPVLEAPDLTTVMAESSIIECALEAASLFIVYLKWLPNPCPKFVACKTCQVGFNAKVALKHAKEHGILFSSTQSGALKLFLNTEKLAAQKNNPSPSPENSAPIEGLAVSQGFKCSHCPYCIAGRNTMISHFSKENPGKAGTYADNSTSTFIQTSFAGTKFPSLPVDSVHTGLASDDLYSAFLDQLLPIFKSSTLGNEALSPDEIPPLLKVTLWHKHLAKYLKTLSS